MFVGTVSLSQASSIDSKSYHTSECCDVLSNSLGLRNRTDFICPDEELMRIWNPAVVKSKQRQRFDSYES